MKIFRNATQKLISIQKLIKEKSVGKAMKERIEKFNVFSLFF
jgi:hypothetical protein